jgi:poly(3-hydroxybutyrate) depolymerase
MPRIFVRSGSTVAALVLTAVVLRPPALRADAPPLPAYNADIAQTSISGVSSGAFMAVQFATAWSSVVAGVGAVAGGPFGCSEGSAATALSTCMQGEPAPDVAALVARTDAWSRSGAIDDTANIARQAVYLFRGYNDTVVARPVSDALHAFYAHYRPQSLFYQTAIGAGHALVTIAYGGDCADNGGQFINRCGYDQAGAILQHIYGALNPRNEATPGGRVITFRQRDFTAPREPADDSLDQQGYAYVPAACEARQPCRVHVALHGCRQSHGDIGDAFIRHAGYNEWADTNRIIVLYPQIRALGLTGLGITNPESCWDWWGYLDANPTEAPIWLLQSGRQIGAIKAMLDRITSGVVAPTAPATPPLAPPSTVVAADAGDTAIDLAWTAVPGATAYEVFRSAQADPAFHSIATVGGLSYGDAGLEPATEYRYRIRASNGGAIGGLSAVVARQTRHQVPPCSEPGTCAVR